MIGRCISVAILVAGILCTSSFAQHMDAPVSARPIDHFKIGDTEERNFGALTFVGGLDLRSSNPHFGAVSGMRLTEKGSLTAIADTGFWFSGKLQRDSTGRPIGLTDGKIAPVLDEKGRAFQQKWSADLEGLTFSGKTAFISTEMDMRVLRFDPSSDLFATPSVRETRKFNNPKIDLRFAFEAIATLPDDHPLHPALIIIAETDASGGKNVPAYILKNGERFALTVNQRDGMFVTDADFLPNGDLLLLERRFSLSRGLSMRLRQIPGIDIREGAALDGKLLFEADRSMAIDNMEAMSVFRGPTGNTHIALMSDNNHWLMQRTLYLEFTLR